MPSSFETLETSPSPETPDNTSTSSEFETYDSIPTLSELEVDDDMPTLSRKEGLLRYESLGERGETARAIIKLIEKSIIGTEDSVHGKLVALYREGLLKDDHGASYALVEFDKQMRATLQSQLHLSDKDWEAIVIRMDQDWRDSIPERNRALGL